MGFADARGSCACRARHRDGPRSPDKRDGADCGVPAGKPPISVRPPADLARLARVHHGSTSVSTGGSTRRLRVPAKRSRCSGFSASCARPGLPFTRRSTTHNREVDGSNPSGAMPVVQRNAVSRDRRKMSSRSPSCRALVDTLLFHAQSGNGLRAARLINPFEGPPRVHNGAHSRRSAECAAQPQSVRPIRMRT